jgi:metallo-beta-lactamase family protein
VSVKAQVSQIEGLSAHADSNGIVEWLRGFHEAPRKTWVVHGERDASDALRLRIQDELGWRVQVPEHSACVEF